MLKQAPFRTLATDVSLKGIKGIKYLWRISRFMNLIDGFILLAVAFVLYIVLTVVFLRIAVGMVHGVIAHYTQGEGVKQLKGAAQAAIPSMNLKQMGAVAVQELAKSGVIQEIGQAVGQWIKSKIPGGK